jgi:ATP-dependent helicase HrpA
MNMSLNEASRLIRHVRGCDRGRLKKKLDKLRKSGNDDQIRQTELLDDIKASVEERNRRLKLSVDYHYPENLPIIDRRREIVEAITKHQVLVLSGETGSGKTTQIPKMCMEAGRGVDGLIGCTQPRRIAALTVSARIAEELQADSLVGYKIRFHDSSKPENMIRIMTDGILLAEAQGHPSLRAYDTLIIDEAHERSLNIDVLLGMVRRLIERRQDLKVIITSATLDTEKVLQAFQIRTDYRGFRKNLSGGSPLCSP